MNIALTGEKDLLEQARKALIEMGYEDDELWNEKRIDYDDITSLHIQNGVLGYYNHESFTEQVIPLTPSNFNEVINQFKK